MAVTSCAIFAQDVMSPYAPGQIIPASEKTTKLPLAKVREVKDKAARRARSPRERRLEGQIPGIVKIPYGKTASGKRTNIYRIMGQGGVVADFTDYGARLLRVYAPDSTGDFKNIIDGAKTSVIDCEKSGDISEVWKMTPIRRPRATGIIFELETNSVGRVVSNVARRLEDKSPCQAPRVIYWLDSKNQLSIESNLSDTNAVKWVSSLSVSPLQGRVIDFSSSLSSTRYSATTNTLRLALRPSTNVIQKVELKFSTSNSKLHNSKL
jgi:hypothetical protein